MGDFEEIVKDTSPYIYSLSYRLTGSSDEASDLMQDTYLRALQKFPQARNTENPLPWLRRICLNIFIDAQRKSNAKNRMKEVVFPADDHYFVSDGLTPEEEFVIDEEVQRIRSQCYSLLCSTLRLHQRIAFVLVDVFEIDIVEVSEIIGRSPAATKGLLYRARKKMCGRLGGTCSLVNPDNVCRCSSWVSFAHDIQRRREHLRVVLEGRDRSPRAAMKASTLSVIFRALPYLKPPRNTLAEISSPRK